MLFVDLYPLDYYGTDTHVAPHSLLLVGYDPTEDAAYVADNEFDEIEELPITGLLEFVLAALAEEVADEPAGVFRRDGTAAALLVAVAERPEDRRVRGVATVLSSARATRTSSRPIARTSACSEKSNSGRRRRWRSGTHRCRRGG